MRTKNHIQILFALFMLNATAGFSQQYRKGNPSSTPAVNSLTFYTEDFSSGFPLGWQNNDSAGTTAIWKYTTTGNSSMTDALNTTGTSAANGYMIFDSDEVFGTNGDAWMITGVINCIGKTKIHLTFNEFFKQDQNNVGEVSVSNDGINWISVHNAEMGLSNGGDVTPNPNTLDIDISAIADGNSTVYIAFRYFGNTGYYWMVDDVSLQSVYSNNITGRCFIDNNQNGIADAGEPAMSDLMVNSSGVYNWATHPNAQGIYSNFVDTGNFTTRIIKQSPSYTVTPLQQNSYFSSYFSTDTINFAFVPIPGIQDLRITMIPLSPLRLGSDVVYRLQYSNVGTDTMSGTVNMKKDYRTSYKSSTPAFLSTNGDSASWSYSTLLPNESRFIDVTLAVAIPPIANFGDLLSYNCVIEPVVTDTTQGDNYFGLGEQPIIGSYDPNDKTMLGGDNFTTDQLANGDFLIYLIRFQNTGNDTAFKIVVRDTLDNKLDGSTFEMVSASNDYSLSIEDQRNIAWTFNNVLLPDSNVNEPASHGYVCYRIKAKSGVSAGDVISNTGHIFFDYNPDVITNTTMTSVVSAVQEIHSTASGWLLYPNPAKDEFTVYGLQSAVGATLEVFNLIGERLHSEKVAANQVTVSCKQFPEGIYFIRVSGNAGTLRLVKVD